MRNSNAGAYWWVSVHRIVHDRRQGTSITKVKLKLWSWSTRSEIFQKNSLVTFDHQWKRKVQLFTSLKDRYELQALYWSQYINIDTYLLVWKQIGCFNADSVITSCHKWESSWGPCLIAMKSMPCFIPKLNPRIPVNENIICSLISLLYSSQITDFLSWSLDWQLRLGSNWGISFNFFW